MNHWLMIKLYACATAIAVRFFTINAQVGDEIHICVPNHPGTNGLLASQHDLDDPVSAHNWSPRTQ